MSNLSIIVAVAENNIIGDNNQLIWYIPDDLKRFKSLTMGHHIIMGRKTWESIGRPLPGRKSIVVTRNINFKADGALVANSLPQALEMAKDDDEAFIIGGGELYQQALPLASRLYLTKVHKHFEGDVAFPDIDYTEWHQISSEKGKPNAKDGLEYSFVNLERNG